MVGELMALEISLSGTEPTPLLEGEEGFGATVKPGKLPLRIVAWWRLRLR